MSARRYRDGATAMTDIDYNVSLDVSYYGSEYSFFGDTVCKVDPAKGILWDVFFKNLTIVDVNGDDVFHLGARFPGDLSPTDGFLYDMAVDVVMELLYEKIVDHARSEVYKNRASGDVN